MVGIVVVTYNRLELLKEVVESLRNQTFRDFKIIVINNDSPDGTKDWLAHQSDIITINQGNVGGAGGFYTGMKYVAENGFDYCWIMDDDVICQPNALNELIKGIQIKPEIGFVCSKVVGLNGDIMNTPNIDGRYKSNGYADWLDLLEEGLVKINDATFVSVLFPVTVIHEFGLPFREYFIWGDDTEYTSRISAKRECYVVGKSLVVHKRLEGTSLTFQNETDPRRLKNYFYMYRNRSYTSIFRKNKKLFKKQLKSVLQSSIKQVLLFKFDKAKILLSSQIALLKFKPHISYPDKSSNND